MSELSVERIVLDLQSGCLGSIPTGGNILPLDFFHVVKPLMSILPILSIYKNSNELTAPNRNPRWREHGKVFTG